MKHPTGLAPRPDKHKLPRVDKLVRAGTLMGNQYDVTIQNDATRQQTISENHSLYRMKILDKMTRLYKVALIYICFINVMCEF